LLKGYFELVFTCPVVECETPVELSFVFEPYLLGKAELFVKGWLPYISRFTEPPLCWA